MAISNQNSIHSVSGNAKIVFHSLTLHAQDYSKIALILEVISDSREVFSLLEIERFSKKIANGLMSLVLGKGDRIFTILTESH